MCDCFHLAFPNWHAASSGTGGGRRLRGTEPRTDDDSTCDEPSQFTEGERPRPQGSSPVAEYPETGKYADADKERGAEHDPHHKSGSGKKSKKSGLGSMFEKRLSPKMSKLKQEDQSPESGVIVKTAKDGCAEGLIYGGGGKAGIFIKEVVPESPASKSLKLKEGDQVLSATVYFDNVSYEDAIQIMEHAQAYKVKLCLKRKPDITENEPAMESDVIPEEELEGQEMREQGKTKKRGDARISWPKFPSFGKGRKSTFTRSHSSSEADEQRKLELSPTTSDTDSPIKSQNALKGKKKHKMKLPVLTKKNRISSSEDQDTDAPTNGQISGDIYQTASEMHSPEGLESLSGETPEVYMTEDPKVVEDLTLEQGDHKPTEPQIAQHKVELISIDSTLKTADLTVALADQDRPSGIKSLDENKNDKERSELKMTILEKDAKPKASPKRLKTLGASIEKADQPENEKSDDIPGFESHTEPQGDQLQLDANTQIFSSKDSKAKSVTTQMEMSVPKVELDISDLTVVQKSPQKGELKKKKGKDTKQKQEKKTSPTFKLPKIGFGDNPPEETVQKMNVNVEECPTKVAEQLKSEGTELKEDPYDRLSKSSLPKREEIEIPGMEDMSTRTTAKGYKEPKVAVTGHYEEIQAETLQMSIDVDSVKEAVSKLPGFKLPKVDTSGVPIPEEITVIDANAQRISVKTPTKVVDTKQKHEALFPRFDITAAPEISKTTVKLPKITLADSASEEPLIETKGDLKKTEKEFKTKAKKSDKEMKTGVDKREDIIIPGKEISQEVAVLQAQENEKTQGTESITSEYESYAIFSPKESDKKFKKPKISMPSLGIAKPDISIPDIRIDLPKQNISEPKCSAIKGERTLLIQEVKTSKNETRKGKGQIGGIISDVKIPEADSIEYTDSVGGIGLTGFDVNLDATKGHISFQEIGGEVKEVGAEEKTSTLDRLGRVTPDISINMPDADKDINIDGAEIKIHEKEADGQGSKFKIPDLGFSMPKVKGPKIDLSPSKKNVDFTLPEAPKTDITLGNVDISIPEKKLEVKMPELEVTPLQTEDDSDGQGSKFKMPKLGIRKPKTKGPEFDLSLSKKDVDVTLPEAKAEVKLPEGPEIDASLGSVDFSIPEHKMKVEKPELEGTPPQTEGQLDGKGSKFKMPKLGIKMPKIKGPEFDLSLSKKDVDVTLPEAKVEVNLPEAPEVDVTLESVDVSIPEQKLEVGKPDLEIKPLQNEGELDGQGSKFKIPKLGIKMPKIKGPEFDLSLSKKDVDVTLPEAKAEVKLPEGPEIDASLGSVDFSIPEHKMEVEKPELEGTPPQTDGQLDGKGSKFKMPKLGIKMPKIKGPEFDLSLSKKDVDVTLSEAIVEVKLPEAPEADVTLGSVDGSISEKNVEVEKTELEIKPLQTESELDGQGSKFKMPRFGIKMPKIKGPEFDLSLSKKDIDVTLPEAKAEVKLPEAPEIDTSLVNVDVSIPEQNVEVQMPELEIKPLQTQGELDGQGSKFKMPKLGITMPKVKGPEIDLSLSKKDVDVTLPETKAEVSLPDVDLKDPSSKVGIKSPEIKGAEKDAEGSALKFKMPTFKFPKFGATTPNVSAEISGTTKDMQLPETELKSSEGVDTAGDITAPHIDIEGPSLDGKGSKFKMPKFGIPKVKGPEIDLSLSKKDVDATLAKAEVDAKLPDVKHEEPGIKVEVKAPEFAVQQQDVEGSTSKFKMPTFKLPKFGVGTPNVSMEVPDMDKDVKINGADINIPEEGPTTNITAPGIDFEGRSLDIKTTATEQEGKGGKFKMPHLGFSMPKTTGPKTHLSLSKKDVEVILPEAKADVKLPGVDLGKVEVSIPEARMEVPEAKAVVTLPEAPKIDVSLGKAEVLIPEAIVEVKKPKVQIKPLQTDVEPEGQGSKFKKSKFGITMPKVKGSETDSSLSKKDVDVTLLEAKAEVKLPDVDPSAKVESKTSEIEAQLGHVEGSPSKFKLPTFKFPKFGAATTNLRTEVPDMDKDIKIDGTGLEIPIDSATADIAAQDIDTKGLTIDGRMGTEGEGKGSKFKVPKFGISLPKVKEPEMVLSISKKDVDVNLPEAEVKLPEASETDVNVGKIDVSFPAAEMEVKKPELDIKDLQSEIELDRQRSKFKIPKLGMSMPKVKGPETEFSLSKKDVDIKLREAKAEVTIPDVELKESSAKVEVEAPEPEAELSSVKGSPSKFKLPTFKFPKFGAVTPNVSMEVPDTDKDIKIDGDDMHISTPNTDIDVPEVKAEVHLPEVEVKEPSSEVAIEQQPGVEVEAKPKKSRFSLFSFSKPSVKAPEVDVSPKDVDVAIPEGEVEVEVREGEVAMKLHKGEVGAEIGSSLTKKDVDVTLPEVKVDVKLPDVELKEASAEMEIIPPEIKIVTKDTEGSPSKFKMPSFKFPRFGGGIPSSTVVAPDIDKEVKMDGAEIKIPEEVLEVNIAAPSIDTEGPSIDIKTTGTEHEEESSAKVEIKPPEIEGSQSKFKMPSFKLPKFGAATPQASVEVPDVEKDIKVDEADLNLPEAKAEVRLPDVEIKEPVGSISVPEVPMAEDDAKIKKTSWALPKFSFSKTSVKGPEADVNLDTPKVEVTLPEAETEIHPPDIDIKESSSISVEGAPATDLDAKLKKPRFSLPKFSFSKQSTQDLEVDVSLPDVDVSLPEGNVEVKPSEVENEPPQGDAKLDKQESRFKIPRFGISVPKVREPESELSSSKKDEDVKLPEAKAEVLPAKVEIKTPEIETQTGNVEGSASKFKMPTFTLPKFGAATPKVSVEAPDGNKDIKIEGAKLEVPKEGGTVDVTAPSIDAEGLSLDVKAKGSELEKTESKSKMSYFGISKPKVKGPEVDLSLSKKGVDVTLQEAKTEVTLPSVEVKEPRSAVSVPDAPTVEPEATSKRPTWTFPKFSFSRTGDKAPDGDVNLETPKVDVTLPEAKAEVSLPDVEVKAPSEVIAVEEPPAAELDGNLKKPKFSLPKFSFSKSSVTPPEDSAEPPSVDVSHPEGEVKIKEPEMEIKAPEVEAKLDAQGSKFKLSRFGIGLSKPKGPEIDLSVSQKDAEVTQPEVKAEVNLPEVTEPEMEIKAPEVEAKLDVQGSKFKFPRFGLGLSKAKGLEVDLIVSQKEVEVTLPEVKAEVKLPEVMEPEMEIKAPEVEAKLDAQGSKFKFPRFGIGLSKQKGPEVASEKDVEVTLPEVKAEVNLPEVEIKESSASVETEEKSKDAGGSSLQFKMPTLKMPKFGSATYDVTVEATDADKAETDGATLKEDLTASIKASGTDIETDLPRAAILDSEMPKTETDGVGQVSPSKFKMPLFKIPRLSFSRSKPEDDNIPGDNESKEDQVETDAKPQEETKPSKLTLTSFGEILKNIDVEFDVSKTDNVEQNLETLKEFPETSEPKETKNKQETTKTPEKTGWFKFPRFGLTSPSSEKDKSPVGEEGISPTSSIQSSDAFADISSTMTSDNVGLPLSSPTKVTVKYSDPNATAGHGEIRSNTVTSTTRTGMISVEPNLPEKITIPSSGHSSSSEDTLRLDSGKIHVVKTNIQAAPEAHHAKILTAFQIQSVGGFPLKSGDAASRTAQDSRIVTTKQITHVFDSTEPISDETASSIQRLKDSVHSKKMRFFDGAKK